MATKICPFCIEEINAEALKCRYCHEAVHQAVMQRLITKEQIDKNSQRINQHLSSNNRAAAKAATRDLVMALKIAPNGAAFYGEFQNAVQAFKALGGSDAELQTDDEKARKTAGSSSGAQWSVGVMLPLSLLGFGSTE